jgi:hypothetical protein
MELEALINKCISKKDNNKEFALFYLGEWDGKEWRAEIGNPSSHVMLGEIGGEVSAEGDTALEAVQKLFEVIP